ncbi:MAG: restriction endonuclease subunit S [Candidatus Electryonea clarkiae]|nr:restriction endonuclease subunit S [Candidatus Electryonea clarkiae]MDP8285213.1 restriction endonuclease subunit S [Candidatus Electryonea clarkiae]
MRDGWRVLELKELCYDYKKDIVDGPFGANLKREHFVDHGTPVLKIQNIKPFEIVLKKMDYVSEEKAKELQRHAYKKGDIIITKLGLPLGVSAIVEDIEDGIIVADLVRVRAQEIDTKYLCYHLNSPVTNTFLNAQKGGATRPRVRIAAVRELPIVTPPLTEQKRIVAILDEAFAGIATAVANAEKNLASARELFESHLNAIFSQNGDGWVRKDLGDVCTLQRGFDLPKRLRINGSYPLISSSGCIDNHVESKVKGPGVVTGRSGSIGSVFFIEEDFWPLNTTLYVKDFHGNIPQFIYYLLKNFDLLRFASGTGVPTLNRNNVHSEPVSVTSSKFEQMRIVEQLNLLHRDTQKLESIYQQKLNTLAELKQSILQKAFVGELTAEIDNFSKKHLKQGGTQ